jgi:2-polyprenyl-6-methoxyphenol hydroxylase-like FAD-dependent oxidoreductase
MIPVDVVVVGAGPTGLMLACELALNGLSCRVLERRAQQPNVTRAFAVHARTLELLDARGLADELVNRGVPVREVQPVPGATLDLRELHTRFPMILIAPQSGTEHVLEARAQRLGVEIARGVEVVGLSQDPNGVTLAVAGADSVTARYVVGCDGAHSTIRDLIGVDFVGKQYETHIMLADVRLGAPPDEAMFARANNEGAVIVVPFGDGWFRAIAWDRRREQTALDVPLRLEEMRDAFERIAGTDFDMTEQRWSSRFLSERRQARHYRVGRVFLAGDAAHVHSPLGGQGMNTGIQDAFNLGWKLAAAVHGQAPASLLDSYETERHRVGAQVLTLTDAFNRLVLGRSRLRRALQVAAVRMLLRLPATRGFMAGRMTGLAITYPPTARHSHPWAGRRAPDVECEGGRLYELLRHGGFVLIDATASGAATEAVEFSPGIVRAVRTRKHGDPTVPAVTMVRPDGYVAWACDDTGDLMQRVERAVQEWCGPGAEAAPPRGART